MIDPGDEPQRLLAEVEKRKLQLAMVILTHFHFDHVAAAAVIRALTKTQVAIHHADAPFLANQPELYAMLAGTELPGVKADRLLNDNDQLTFGTQTLAIISTPGHSPGGICLYDADAGVLFSGDTLFRASIGRTDFTESDREVLLASIRARLFTLPGTIVVYPGHGPKTTITYEVQHNPFINA
jgi:glyoxylase-like metal-dependent hydrolase (beta-lactamase superfamily II)